MAGSSSRASSLLPELPSSDGLRRPLAWRDTSLHGPSRPKRSAPSCWRPPRSRDGPACVRAAGSPIGEIKKQRYVYYYCTGYADKCQGKPASCRRKYVREEVLEAQFTELLGRLRFDDEVLDWVREALFASHADKRREQEEAIARLRAEWERLQKRLDAMYVDKLDGRVDGAFFERMSAEWRADLARCQREIDRHQEADRSYMDEGVRILELARNAQRLFARQEPRQKRRLLNFVLSNCSWEDGAIVATFRQPFDLLAQTVATQATDKAAGMASSRPSAKWLPFVDAYRTMCLAPKPEFRSVLEEIREVRFAA